MTQSAQPLTFSLIIPCRNEREHIAGTIDCCLGLDYPHKEIIVVDDSTDDTPRIVERYADRGVRLIHREENRNGCCGARNVGMQNATGDIIVIINGDVRPRADFLARLVEHYRDGADWVVCESNAVNTDNLWARFIHAQEQQRHGCDWMWSEGFSCRREAAAAVGYIPGDFPVPFCRDVMLGEALLREGYRRHQASEIFVDHIAHDTFDEFWGVRVARASWSAITFYFFETRSPRSIFAHELLKAARSALVVVTLVVPAWRALVLSRYVGRLRFPGLFVAELVREAAQVAGALRGVRKLSSILLAGRHGD